MLKNNIRAIILCAAPWQINPRHPEYKYGYIMPVHEPPKPKCLLHNNRTVLLDNQERILTKFGVKDIRIIVNYKKEEIQEHINIYNLNIKSVYNPDWEHPANSIELGVEGAEEDVIILFGDVWLTEEAMDFLINSDAPYSTIYSPNVDYSKQNGYIHGIKIKKEYIKPFIKKYREMFPTDIKAYNFDEVCIEVGEIQFIDEKLKDFDVYEWTEDFVQDRLRDTIKTIGYAFVVGDLLHYGHLNFFKECKKHCDVLIVGVYTDELAASYKRKPIIPFTQRLELLKYLSLIYMLIEVNDRCCIPALKQLEKEGWKADVLFHGTDWNPETDEDLRKSKEYIESTGGKFIQPEYYKGVSTTKIIKEIIDRYKKGEFKELDI